VAKTKEKNNNDNVFHLKSRKAHHVKIVVEEDVSVEGQTNFFEYFDIIPSAIPDIDFEEVSTETKFLGKTFSAPILIAGMTGGYPEAKKINQAIAEVCQDLNIPMGVGSQRAMLADPSLVETFDVKKFAPDVFLIGNIGLVQLNYGYGVDDAQRAVDLINADAIAVHVNAFQELMQPEGDTNFKGLWEKMEEICKTLSVPVIGKEVGSGMSWQDVLRMQEAGCSAVDVGGAGGTSWPKIEILRHVEEKTKKKAGKPLPLNDPLLKWGVPTALATWEATTKTNIPIISTGGMYHPLSAAKALLMGAKMVGIARPVLKILIEKGKEGVKEYLEEYILNVKRIMFLVGAKNIEQMTSMKWRLVPWGRAKDWLEVRKLLL